VHFLLWERQFPTTNPGAAGTVLVTGDERIAAAPGARCDIQVIK
jgi:hypothetical protein